MVEFLCEEKSYAGGRTKAPEFRLVEFDEEEKVELIEVEWL